MHARFTSRDEKIQRISPSGFVPSCRATITGVGMLTPLGLSAGETWDALLAGGYIRDHSPIPLSGFDGKRPRVNEFAVRAARQAIQSAGWSPEDLSSDETALVVGTSKGPIESWTTPLHAAWGSKGFGLSETAADVVGELCLGMGPQLTVSAACATGLHALIRASMLIESGLAKRVLVVAAESSLGPLFVGSFKRLGVIAVGGCKPFDLHRTGFLMSEGAAAVCLEPPSRLNDSGIGGGVLKRVGIESFAMGADATHLTGGDREGGTLRHLLSTVLGDRPVDFIHAHGTGTEINDATELAAIESQLTKPCPVYSHKGALGHSLGAAGLISVVLNCFAHSTATVPPNVQTDDPVPTDLVRIESEIVHLPKIRRSIVMAAGFGGSCGVISVIS